MLHLTEAGHQISIILSTDQNVSVLLKMCEVSLVSIECTVICLGLLSYSEVIKVSHWNRWKSGMFGNITLYFGYFFLWHFGIFSSYILYLNIFCTLGLKKCNVLVFLQNLRYNIGTGIENVQIIPSPYILYFFSTDAKQSMRFFHFYPTFSKNQTK